ncbi:MAG: hypothetical protein KatS3mg087_0517 [Patescibacteria group bacterium]|nr:MAG: hypothetical protein KatS3mg087_0517 [Patescibacteria group bacterium]
MTQAEFRELILLEVRKFLPEVPSWDDMARFVRISGAPVSSPDNLDYSTAMTNVERAAFRKYASILEHERASVITNKNAGDPSTNIDNFYLLTVEDLAIAKGHNQPEPRIYPLKTVSRPPYHASGRTYRYLWAQAGNVVTIYPTPNEDYTLFLTGVVYPHYDSGQLVAVTPGDEYTLARYIAAEFLEPFNPQITQVWRQEAITEWVLERQKRAWSRHFKGRNVLRRVF